MNYEQLKNSILQEAIEGRLVPQDPSDEPAAVLLQRIREEKARLVKEKKIKKDKNESIIYRNADGHWMERFEDKKRPEVCIDEEIPFEIPETWEWCRLSEITFNHGQKKPDVKFSYIDIGSINNKRQKLNKEENLLAPEKAPSRARKIVKEGDIIYSTVRPYLHNMAIIDKDFSCEPIASTGFAVLACINGIFNKYLFYYLMSPSFDQYANDGNNAKGIAYPAINDEKLYKALVPLPPLSEQHRIVSRIEEIMPKVEEYGKAQEKLDALNAKLPKDLKNSILLEAIEGRLVPQNPSDEPAAVLLQRIRQEKARLVKEKKIKKDKNESIIYRNADGHWMERFEDKKRPEECIDDEIPFEIPESWEWTRLRHHLSISAGLAYKKDNLAIKSDKMIRVLRGGNISYGSWSSKDDDIMISSEFVNEDLLLKRGTFISPAVTSLEQMGKTALIESDLSDIVVGGFVMMFSPYLIEPDYLKYLNDIFQTAYYKKYCQSVTNKSGQAFYNLSKAKLSECLIPLPPLSEQHRIVSQLESLLPKVARLTP
jgi:type I restriction enzyme S subunit